MKLKETAITLLLLTCLVLFYIILFPSSQQTAAIVPISLFPLDRYNQNIESWIKPNLPENSKSLVSKVYQQKRMEDFYNHTFATGTNAQSPWDRNFVQRVL